jgi:hypothetical protein
LRQRLICAAMFSGDEAPIARRCASESRDIENLRYIIVEVWRKLFHFRDSDLIQWNAFRYGVHNKLSNDLVRLAKRRSLFHEVPSQIGRALWIVSTESKSAFLSSWMSRL